MTGAESDLIFIGNEQPETCRKCGMRTDFVALSVNLQIHKCPVCNFEYYLEFEG